MNGKEKLGKQQINDVAGGMIIFKELSNGNVKIIANGPEATVLKDSAQGFIGNKGFLSTKIFSWIADPTTAMQFALDCKEHDIKFKFYK